MTPPEIRFHFDVVDPLSYLVELELHALEDEGALPPVARSPVELRPPPAELMDPDREPWTTRRARAEELADGLGLTLARPRIIPWSRKAHELLFHAREVDRERAVRTALLHAFHRDGEDVGRVDVLVRVATELGLDRTRTKAVLDVDRHAGAVVRAEAEARELGVGEPPALWTGAELVQGFHDRDALRTLLVP
jgi:predicted DsbA family dithiol-disulfide isomerase